MRLALYQPDIPQNLGAALRLTACLGIALDVIEPCGFPLTDKALKRAALDYGELATPFRHASFAAFLAAPERAEGRLILLETDGETGLYDAAFHPADTLIVGRESAGSPPEVYAAAAQAVRIPMIAAARSLNVITAAAIALGEALRQTKGWRPDR